MTKAGDVELNDLILLRQSVDAIQAQFNEQFEALAAELDRLIPETKVDKTRNYAAELKQIIERKRKRRRRHDNL